MSKGARVREQRRMKDHEAFFHDIGLLIYRWQGCAYALARLRIADRGLSPAGDDAQRVVRHYSDMETSKVAEELRAHCEAAGVADKAPDEALDTVNGTKHLFTMPELDGSIRLLVEKETPEFRGQPIFLWVKKNDPNIYRLSHDHIKAAIASCWRLTRALSDAFTQALDGQLGAGDDAG